MFTVTSNILYFSNGKNQNIQFDKKEIVMRTTQLLSVLKNEIKQNITLRKQQHKYIIQDRT